MKKLVVILVSMSFVFLVISCKPKVAEEVKEPAEVVTTIQPTEFEELPFIVATELYDQFKQDSQAALLKYKDKKFNIIGEIEIMGEDEIGRPYVVLGKAGGDGFNAVTCIFTKKDQDALSKLIVGDSATIKGTVHDYLMNVIIYDCSIVK